MKPIPELRLTCALDDPIPVVNTIIDTVNELVRRENYHSQGATMPSDNAERAPEHVTNEQIGEQLRRDLLPSTSGLTFSQIAQICHGANRALCQILGDDSQPEWDDAPKWQRDSALSGVVGIDEGKIRNAGDSHISWAAQKIDDGWKWGPVKDPDAKTHPCLVPFHELPYDQRLKDHLFLAVATALLRN